MISNVKSDSGKKYIWGVWVVVPAKANREVLVACSDWLGRLHRYEIQTPVE